MFRGTACFASLIVFAAIAEAKDLYVAVNHSRASDNNPGTQQLPLKSLQRAADLAQPGDTVSIAPGTYLRPEGRNRVLEILRGGREGAPITFMASGGEVILDNQNAGDWVLYVNARYSAVDDVILRGLTVKGGISGGIFLRNTNRSVVERCKVKNNQGVGIYIGYGGSHQRVDHCETAFNGIGIKAGDCTGLPQPSHVRIQYNHCHHNVGEVVSNSDGIQCVGNGNYESVIANNVVHDNGDDGIDAGGQGDAPRHIIEKNVVFNQIHPQGDGSGIKLGTHDAIPTGGHIVRYNIIFNCKLRALDLAGNYRYPTEFNRGLRPEPTLVYNNTLLNLDGGLDLVYLESMDALLRNNISLAPNNGDFWICRLRGHSDEPPFVNSDFNLWCGRGWIKDWDGQILNSPPYDQHSLPGDRDPKFIDAENPGVITDLNSPYFGMVPGLCLSPDSPALEAGVNMQRELTQLLTQARRDGNEKWVTALQYALDHPAEEDAIPSPSLGAVQEVFEGNHLPSAPELSLSPEKPDKKDTLTCTIVQPSQDSDGDTISQYEFLWFAERGNERIKLQTQVETGLSDALDASRTRPGDRVICVARGFDGKSYGLRGKAVVKVQ